jgi:hypothetical protein
MQLRKRRRLLLLLGGAAGATAIAVSAALAAGTVGGKTVARVKVVVEAQPNSTSSTTFVDLPGATTTIVVPRRTRALVLARFTGESTCDGGAPGNVCSLRMVIGAGEGGPSAGLDFAFDSDPTAGGDGPESHAAERAWALRAGTYTVRVQWAVTAAATTFTLDDWTLVVERIRR